MNHLRLLGPVALALPLLACSAGSSSGSGGGGGEASSGGSTSDGGSTTNGGSGGAFATTTTTTTGPTGCPQNCTAITVGPCEHAVCNMDTYTCDVLPLTDGTACDDGLFCTDGDSCQAGECVAGPPRDCGESTDCGTATCDEAGAACSYTSMPNGTPCVSADLCLDPNNTVCQAGTCVGAPKDCGAQVVIDSPECQAPACDPVDGSCIVTAINDGIPCTYGDICESNKACNAGVCEGMPINGCTACNESEANNSIATADSGMGCASWAGAIAVVGDQDYYRVDVTVPGSRIAASVVDVNGMGCPSGFDSVIRLWSSGGTQLASDDQSGVSPCSAFLPTNAGTTNLAVGTYYISVEDWLNNGISPPYLLLVSVLPPGCGNGIIEAGEQCDDSNTMNGDLCSSTCQTTPICGDGIITAPEQCDDGNLVDGDTCSSTCTATTYDCLVGQTQVTINGAAGLPMAITDNATFTNTINVPNVGTITKVAIALDITHTFDADLDISIDAPNAAPEILSNDNGGGGDNFIGTIFAAGGTLITMGTAPFTGVFSPQGNFANIVGTQANGNWVLTITDDAGGDVGTLNAWSVHLCIQ